MYSHTPIYLYLSNFCQFVLEIYLENVPSLNAGGGRKILPTSSSSSTSFPDIFNIFFLVVYLYVAKMISRA